jgi:hypothetical protein
MKSFSGFRALPVLWRRIALSRDKVETMKWLFRSGMSTFVAFMNYFGTGLEANLIHNSAEELLANHKLWSASQIAAAQR